MPLSELQWGLIAVGAGAVAAVVGYNKLQERKFRKRAEEVFRSDHADVLLEPKRAEPVATEHAERLEPTLGDAGEQAADGARWEIGPPHVDASIDCVFGLESAEPVTGGSLTFAQQEVLGALGQKLRWFGWQEPAGPWVGLGADSAEGHRHLRAAVQLADRSGALSEGQVDALFDGVRRLADRFLAVAETPTKEEVKARAAELDRFCAAVDVQIGVNVVSGAAGGFPGTKLRGIAEAAGFVFAGNGTLEMRDDTGRTLFALGNLEAAALVPEAMRDFVTHGLTLTLDVPRVAGGAEAFDGMVRAGRRLAESLGGALVDDNRVALGDKALDFIRAKIVEFQSQMSERGIAPGSETALRLFG